MKETNLDVRNQACPIPVVRSKKAMEESERVTVLVTGSDQVENVTRMAERSGWITSWKESNDHFIIILNKQDASGDVKIEPEDLVCSIDNSAKALNRVVAIASETMGGGDDKLGKVLMRSFLSTVKDLDHLPHTILFYNGGVKLTVDGSLVIPDLEEFQEMGIELLVCGTCLDFFGLKDKILVGTVSNMYDIAGAMVKADRLTTIG